MDIYLDSADASQWSLPAGCPPVIGVTTNPSLIFQAGLSVTLASYEQLVRSAGAAGMAQIMLQLPTNGLDAARTWVEKLQTVAAHERISLTMKLPCHPSWTDCIGAVKAMQQPILLTGLSNAVQLLWAHSMRADFVAPYVGRLAADTSQGGRDVWALIQACVAAQSTSLPHPGPQLLAASIKSPDVLSRLMGMGAAAVTLPPSSLIAWSQDPVTDAAMAQFDRDTAASQTPS